MIRASARNHVQGFVQGLGGPLEHKALVPRALYCSTIGMEWLSYLTGIVTTPIVVGLAAWLGKVWAGRILAKDRVKYQTSMETLLADLRTGHTKELFVHQLQFQKEFEIYKELWVAALEVARAASHFRELQVGPPASTGDALQSIKSSHDRLRDTVFENRPFYEAGVYEAAKAIRKSLDEVVRKHQHLERLERLERGSLTGVQIDRRCAIDDETERKLDEINCLRERLCSLIRSRIWSTTASGWDRPCGQ